jgi:hypothetical protein
MKKTILSLVFLSMFSYANAAVEDNSIIDALKDKEAQVIKIDF